MENPAAFEAAAIRGLAIECDVQLTADGEAVVFHDFTPRTPDPRGKGRCWQRTAAQLAEIRHRASAETIPTRPGSPRSKAAPPLIEVKSQEHGVARVCAASRAGWKAYAGPAAVMIFDARVGGWFCGPRPHVVRGLVASRGST